MLREVLREKIIPKQRATEEGTNSYPFPPPLWQASCNTRFDVILSSNFANPTRLKALLDKDFKAFKLWHGKCNIAVRRSGAQRGVTEELRPEVSGAPLAFAVKPSPGSVPAVPVSGQTKRLKSTRLP